MGTLSRIALFLFLVVGLLASAQGPGTINDPFARARATPLPTRSTGGPVALTPTERAQFRDERLDYYESVSNANFDGQAVMGVGGANDRYMNCRANCANQNSKSVECISACDREYTQSAATNTSEVYKSNRGAPATANGQIQTDGLRMPASMPRPRESSEIIPQADGRGLHKVGNGAKAD